MGKLQAAPDLMKASSELAALSLSDLPKIQLCKFVEQSVTLLSVIFQLTDCPTAELVIQFKEIRKSVDFTLDYMEQTLGAQTNFPAHPSSEDCWF